MKIKVLTLNVEHGGKLLDNILNFLNEQSPDILFIQEAYNNGINSERRFKTVDVFREELGLPYSDFKAYAYDPDIKGDMGTAIFTKFEILETNNFFFDVSYGDVYFNGEHDPPTVPRAMQHVKIYVDGREVNLFNIHGIWDTHGGDSPRRIEMAKTIEKVFKHKENIILAGDTNFDPEATETVRIIESGGVKSVFGDSLTSTFNMKHKTNPGYAQAAVDMIFVSEKFEVLEKSLLTPDVSDHYPLMAVLEFKG